MKGPPGSLRPHRPGRAQQTEAGAGVAQEVTPCPAGPDPVTSLTPSPARQGSACHHVTGRRTEAEGRSQPRQSQRRSRALATLVGLPHLACGASASSRGCVPTPRAQPGIGTPLRRGWTPETHTSQPSAHVARKPIGRSRREAECVARTPAVPLRSQVSRLDVTSSFLPTLLPRLRDSCLESPPQRPTAERQPRTGTTHPPRTPGRDSRFSSVQFGRSVVSDSLRPHGLRHARPP